MSAALRSLPPQDETVTAFISRPRVSNDTFRELVRVVVQADVVTMEGDGVAAGSVGTIVGVWDGGGMYDVDFDEALGPATIAAGLLRLA